jgi:hypothetical protein
MSDVNRINKIALMGFFSILAGCSFEYPGNAHQSNFTYPRSQLTTDKNVYGEATETTFGFGGGLSITGALKQKAVDEALSSVPGANVLINYHEDVIFTFIPTPIPIYTTKYSVQGVAAKAEVK